MKRLWVAVSLIVIALAFGITEYAIVNNSYNKYIDMLETAENYISNKEYSEAYDICSYALNAWEKHEKTLNVFLLHSKVDDVTESIAQLCEYAQEKEKTMFSSTCAKTKRQLLHLRMSELPLFENIM